MSETYESILEAARRLPAEQQRRLAERLYELAEQYHETAFQRVLEMANRAIEPGKKAGKARRHFGAWDSGDERSADNERIDRDLAREYGSDRQS